MKPFGITTVSLLLALTTAAPLQKRDIQYVTVFDEVIVTVEEYTTIWVPAGDIPGPTTLPLSTTASTTSILSSIVSIQSTASEASTAPILLAISSSSPAAITSTAQPPPVVQSPPPPPASSSTTTTPVYTPPTYTPPPAPSSTSTPAPVAPPPATSPAVVSPAPAAAPKLDTGSDSGNVTLPGASIGDGCTPGIPCIGDMTFYNPSQGMGACGPGPNGYIYQDTDMVVAVSHEMMGSLSNGDQENALCWRKLHIFNPSTQETNTGMVVDKCAGCAGNQDIDLSPALYNTLGVSSVGRYHDVQWYWA